MDPQRKRLSVAHVPVAAREASSQGKVESMEDCGFDSAFRDKKWVSITSVTDATGARTGSFAQKDFNVLCGGYESDEQALEVLSSMGIGWTCKKGMKPESPNQDSFCVVHIDGEYSLYGVFDGHGPNGHDVSTKARQAMMRLLVNNDELTTDTQKALKEAFVSTQRAIETMDGLDASTSGTTATVVYHDIPNDALYVAHVGDSRAVLGQKVGTGYDVVFDTEDHKPNLPEEQKRIENSNPPGRVIFDGYYNWRVFSRKGMYPGLNMSRAIGDVVAHKEAGLTAEPDVKFLSLKELRKDSSDELPLLVCSDGVWEFIESNEVLRVHSLAVPQKFVDELAQISYDRWMQDSDGEISDDITAVYVQLEKFSPLP